MNASEPTSLRRRWSSSGRCSWSRSARRRSSHHRLVLTLLGSLTRRRSNNIRPNGCKSWTIRALNCSRRANRAHWSGALHWSTWLSHWSDLSWLLNRHLVRIEDLWVLGDAHRTRHRCGWWSHRGWWLVLGNCRCSWETWRHRSDIVDWSRLSWSDRRSRLSRSGRRLRLLVTLTSRVRYCGRIVSIVRH